MVWRPLDLESPGALGRTAAAAARGRELILLCGDVSGVGSPTALNAALRLRALGLSHVLMLSDSEESCVQLEGVIPELVCAWSSRMNRTASRVISIWMSHDD